MSFFRIRRRGQRELAVTDLQNISPSSSNVNSAHASTISLEFPLTRRLSALSFISSKLTPKKRNLSRLGTPQAGPVGHTVDFPRSYTRESTPSPTPSLDDIRMPVGLGRRASETSKMGEDEEHEGVDSIFTVHDHRSRCVSSPNPTVNESGRGVRAVLTALNESHPPSEHPAIHRVPPELWRIVLASSSRSDLLVLGLASNALLFPTLSAIYHTLDLRDLDHGRVEQCMALLASKRSTAELVRKFTCSFLPSSATGPASMNMVTFAVAFTNMTQLRSLTLPRFDAHLLLHSAFSLDNLEISSQAMSVDDIHGLSIWLTKQPDIKSFSLPDLVMDQLIEETTPTSDSPALIDTTTRHQSLIPDDILPHLTCFDGPASLASLIVPRRPVESVVLHIHTTLYDGLKPSGIMQPLTRSTAGLKSLTIVPASTQVDARTLERVLMSAGAVLGNQLESLEVHWLLEDEVLYKHMLGVIARFQMLLTLRMRCDARSPTSSPRTSSLLGSQERSQQERLSTPPLLTPPASPLRGSRPGSASSALDPPRAQERAHLNSWSKHCPSLRRVVFLSGAVWHCEPVCSLMAASGLSLFAPTFHIIGFVGQ
ncbi:uncharacterized protein FIBRA_02335 [Fibroporia radiculosa]|uniref:Uncharacterized protein n=1 Tax=Fibroporia radiculosa TaxID=599839 RepID=J4GMT2_9APHY|nr:uncharacterized protein FIBRA_02335 [Fibroporia radiculosa]CCM00305.1 predicted protein [Fibroporia radiculosa]